MCGYLFIHNKSNVFDNFDDAFDTLKLRGPDKSRVINFDTFKIGFHRLSIIDCDDRSMQPFTEGDYLIVFNGEIYNYQELKKKLAMSGIKDFKTKSDTEILLKCFIYFGKEIFDEIVGMYSIVILNKKTNKIFFFRDCFGIKPLYYSLHDRGLYVCSSIRSLNKLDKNLNSTNRFNLINFNLYGFTYGDDTIYNKILEARPGAFYEYDIKSDKLISEKKIDLKKILIHNEKINFLQKTDVEETINYHLVSDVQTCVLKSEGLDSNIIHFYKKKIENDDTYLTYNNDKLTVTKNENEIKEILPINNYQELFQNYIEKQEYPTIDGFNTYLITKFANKFKYKVCLSGLGLDEIFNGYGMLGRISLLTLFKNKFKIFSNLKTGSIKFDKLLNSRGKDEFLHNYLNIRRISKYESIYKIFEKQEINIFIDDLKNKILSNLDINETDILFNSEWLRLFEFEFYLKNQLLKDSDYFSMQNSVELRVPFIEKNFVKKITKDHNSNFKKRKFFKLIYNDYFNTRIEKNKKGFIAYNFDAINKFNNSEDIIKNISNKF